MSAFSASALRASEPGAPPTHRGIASGSADCTHGKLQASIRNAQAGQGRAVQHRIRRHTVSSVRRRNFVILSSTMRLTITQWQANIFAAWRSVSEPREQSAKTAVCLGGFRSSTHPTVFTLKDLRLPTKDLKCRDLGHSRRREDGTMRGTF